MKTCLWIATFVVLSAAPAFAEKGTVSDQGLAKFGLHGMKVMSDADGLAIRGKSVTLTVKSTVAGATGSSDLSVTGSTFSVTFDATTAAKNAKHSASASLKGSAASK
jgi:hypothetical protein